MLPSGSLKPARRGVLPGWNGVPGDRRVAVVAVGEGGGDHRGERRGSRSWYGPRRTHVRAVWRIGTLPTVPVTCSGLSAACHRVKSSIAPVNSGSWWKDLSIQTGGDRQVVCVADDFAGQSGVRVVGGGCPAGQGRCLAAVRAHDGPGCGGVDQGRRETVAGTVGDLAGGEVVLVEGVAAGRPAPGVGATAAAARRRADPPAEDMDRVLNPSVPAYVEPMDHLRHTSSNRFGRS